MELITLGKTSAKGRAHSLAEEYVASIVLPPDQMRLLKYSRNSFWVQEAL
jgi:hypothetical protein